MFGTLRKVSDNDFKESNPITIIQLKYCNHVGFSS